MSEIFKSPIGRLSARQTHSVERLKGERMEEPFWGGDEHSVTLLPVWRQVRGGQPPSLGRVRQPHADQPGPQTASPVQDIQIHRSRCRVWGA